MWAELVVLYLATCVWLARFGLQSWHCAGLGGREGGSLRGAGGSSEGLANPLDILGNGGVVAGVASPVVGAVGVRARAGRWGSAGKVEVVGVSACAAWESGGAPRTLKTHSSMLALLKSASLDRPNRYPARLTNQITWP
ncbi:hypothetical protein B0H10DRAFT_1958254 [Mycena sp. CBHHK59/15]|nr:hypothetical protein B0H10DRAFT_1958254 [Mycena sp. CBHHK59/15]